jgi:hypothetical protein
VLQHHVSYDIVNSTYSVYTPNSNTPQLVLKPTTGSREALSLSIFENPHAGRPVSVETSLFSDNPSSSEDPATQRDIRASHISLEPIPEPEAAMTQHIDFTQQPHPRYTYYRGDSTPALQRQPSIGSNRGKRVRHLSTGDLESMDENVTALPQKEHFFQRYSQLPPAQRRSSGLRNVTNISGL